jgi:hypothetical protein
MTAKLAAALALAALAVVPVADAAKKPPPVKLPKAGQYNGHPRGKDLTLYVSGNSIELAAFSFKCASTGGRTSIDALALKKTKKGYRFAFSGHGSITFDNGQPDENGKISISGLFARSGKRATGVFRVRSSYCHDTGSVKWSAKR